LVPGLIVRAVVADPAARNPKARPLVLLTGEDDTPPDAPFIAVAISGTLPKPLPDYYVLLPWDRTGHRQTGLKKKCAAVCDWFVRVNRSESVEVMGRVPDAQFAAIRRRVQELRDQEAQRP
jgi:hypothetical protein